MSSPLRCALLVLGIVAVGACTGKDSGGASGGDGTAGSGGRAQDGQGGGAGTAGTGSSASGGKPKPASIDCGALGKGCDESPGCASSCVASLNLCMPDNLVSCVSDADCPARAPLCASVAGGAGGACVSEPELDCVCANSLGGSAVSRCADLARGARACVGPGGLCDAVPCCDGAACAAGSDGAARCQSACKNGGQDLPCPSTGCCAGFQCAILGTARICKKSCTQNADCTTTGCCAPLGDSGIKVCLDPQYCGAAVQCKLENEGCSATTVCCAGLSCISLGAEYTCRARCATHADCATNCCVASKNTTNSVCLEAQYCP